MKAINLRNQAGFTLIELMIVVGIIGILVAIAAPNFSRYQSKARQSEAKIALAAIYGAEKSFYSEYSAYLSSLDGIGYAPEGSKRFYNIGFAGATTAVTGYTGTLSNNTNFASLANPYACTGTATALGAALGTDQQNFAANAVGCIRDTAVGYDAWSINHLKAITNGVVSL